MVSKSKMQLPSDEVRRLAALHEYDVLDSKPEESFDRVTRLVKAIVGTRSAQISLLDSDRQWFKSRQMVSKAETPRNVSFCTHTIEHTDPMIVRDALADPRFCDSPLVTGYEPIRFYAGMPLRTPKGHNIGALCATDPNPGDISPAQLSAMRDLAGVVMDLLELRRLATVDGLTGAMTGRVFNQERDKAFARFRRYGPDMACIMIDLDHFKHVNDAHGHAAGDVVLQAISKVIASEIRDIDVFGRVGGEEFALVVSETLEGAMTLAEKLRWKISRTRIIADGAELSVTASFGVSIAALSDEKGAQVLERADKALYQAKRDGRNRVVSVGTEAITRLAS